MESVALAIEEDQAMREAREAPAVPEAPQRLVHDVLAEVAPSVARRLRPDRLEPQIVAPVE